MEQQSLPKKIVLKGNGYLQHRNQACFLSSLMMKTVLYVKNFMMPIFHGEIMVITLITKIFLQNWLLFGQKRPGFLGLNHTLI